MIVRLLIAGFASFVGGVTYLAGMTRLMSGLLIAFGALFSLFFGVLFIIPDSENILGFPVYGQAGGAPFFILFVVLVGLVGFILLKSRELPSYEELDQSHGKHLLGGLLGCVASIFIPALFWFPSEEQRLSVDQTALGFEVLVGTLIFILCFCGSLYLLYKASRGGTAAKPDFMRRVVLALFAVFHLDKIPVLIAYLLIYSPETQIIFPNVAALALASYIPVALFLWFCGTDRFGEG